MKVAFFPFQTTRIDQAQGVYARQIPALLAERLVEAGLEAEYVPWAVVRGGRAVHVLVAGSLPEGVVRGERRRVGAEQSVTGFTTVTAGAMEIRADLRRPLSADRPLTESGGAGASLLGAVRGILGRLAEALGADTEAAAAGLPRTDEGLRLLLFDRDNISLVDRFGPDALDDPADGWRHLLAAAVVEDDPALFAKLRRRIESWRDASSSSRTLAASLDLASSSGGTADDWRNVVASISGPPQPHVERGALEAIGRMGELEPPERLRLGVLLIAEERADEAVAVLESAASNEGDRDAAETCLGLALAAAGDVDRAIGLWERVVAEGHDARLVAAAREHLRRNRNTRG